MQSPGGWFQRAPGTSQLSPPGARSPAYSTQLWSSRPHLGVSAAGCGTFPAGPPATDPGARHPRRRPRIRSARILSSLVSRRRPSRRVRRSQTLRRRIRHRGSPRPNRPDRPDRPDAFACGALLPSADVRCSPTRSEAAGLRRRLTARPPRSRTFIDDRGRQHCGTTARGGTDQRPPAHGAAGTARRHRRAAPCRAGCLTERRHACGGAARPGRPRPGRPTRCGVDRPRASR